MKTHICLCLALMLMLVLSACGPDYLYTHKTSFDNDTWTYQATQQHRVEIKDIQHLYHLIIGVTHSSEFAFQNLYIKIKTTFPNHKTSEQILSLNLADLSGEWYGKCRGNTCTIDIPIQQNAIFQQAGTYHFSIEQYMRSEKVPGIKGLSFKVEKSKDLVKK